MVRDCLDRSGTQKGAGAGAWSTHTHTHTLTCLTAPDTAQIACLCTPFSLLPSALICLSTLSAAAGRVSEGRGASSLKLSP